ncbi:RNA-directed DNA polymerase [Pseudonocardia sp. ICBG1293]|uniref:RNA-directed DNA polymerase n=1 Tax=Pseudonocardia sp. ICBG1293 TaxID=2844382 RepID=UPI001CCD3A1A|nr:RNA-directed DNA polymerase [Pseudonocardia sp. ICBG1293]
MNGMPLSVVEKLQTHDAIEAETQWQWDLLPRPVIDEYISTGAQSAAAYMERIAQTDCISGPSDALLANKWRHGRRAIAMLPILDRVLYRAVVASLKSLLPDLLRSNEDFARFKNSPLEVDGAQSVVTTDIANFYSSIPIELLSNLLLDRTGQVEEVRWLTGFWYRVSGRTTGVPQVNESSDAICEMYALELERRVASRNIRTFRYADDFRLIARSEKDAVTALEVFDEEARGLGLFVNERKTYVQSIDSYQQALKGASDPNTIIQEVREDLRDFDLYSFEPIEPEEADVQQGAARRMLSLWKEHQRPWKTGGERLEAAKLAKKAFAVLTQLRDDDAVSVCPAVMDSDPQNTPAVARYLRTLISDGNGDAWRELQKITAELPLSKWQRYWLLDTLRDCPFRLDGSMLDWTLGQAGRNQAEALRTYACWILGVNDRLTGDVWRAAVSGGLTSLGSPTMSGAIIFCHDLSYREKAQLIPNGYFDQGMFDWASDDCPPF